MEPTESAAPDARLRRRRVAGVWWGSWWTERSERQTGAPARQPRDTASQGAPYTGAQGALGGGVARLPCRG
ncbi:hypothetical protein JHN52_08930, partial [Streptomyces sp. MBT97]|uniref:hypothetical protein n=1 Tax=Streptomyces sp. MBT97 TaxID=2800411 RepID=UPI00190A0856